MRGPGLRAALAAVTAVMVSLSLGVALDPPAAAAESPPGAPPVQKQRTSKVKAMDAAGAKAARERVAASKAGNVASAERAAAE
ncbi:hypothetical protein, partial [Nonomuraea longicatena]